MNIKSKAKPRSTKKLSSALMERKLLKKRLMFYRFSEK